MSAAEASVARPAHHDRDDDNVVWKRLWQASAILWTSREESSSSSYLDPKVEVEVKVDPFDCSDIRLASPLEAVDKVVQEYLRKWRQLDERKIVSSIRQPQETNTTNSQETATRTKRVTFLEDEEEEEEEDDETFNITDHLNNHKTNKKRKKFHGGWRLVEDRLRLPIHFDYATEGPEPDDDGVTGDRVLSLTNLFHQQSSTLSYEKELWKLFASIPSARQIQCDDGTPQLPHTLAIRDKIQKCTATTDPFLLSRMRMADRHGVPPLSLESKDYLPDTFTLRLECWRQQLKRPPSPDSNRLVLEFRADQTLLDVHGALVQLAEDYLWEDAAAVAANNANLSKHSGCFAIEDQMFTHGPVDYTKNIMEWIDGGDMEHPHPARKGYLGIPSLNKFQVQPMDQTRLEDIPMRLGVRYYHCCHGDVETAIFLVDRRGTNSSLQIKYPILHDIWTATPANLPICEACQTHAVAYVVADDLDHTESRGRFICETCRQLLKLPASSLQLYASWRDESILSSSAPSSKQKRKVF